MKETPRARGIVKILVGRENGMLKLDKIEGRGSHLGFPDYLGAWCGFPMAIEFKITETPRGDRSEALQAVYLHDFTKAGGFACRIIALEGQRKCVVETTEGLAGRPVVSWLLNGLQQALPGWFITARTVEKWVTPELLAVTGKRARRTPGTKKEKL